MTSANTATAKPVQDWENRDVKGLALCCESLFEETVEKVQHLRGRQSAYEDSLPSHADDAFKEIRKALPSMECIGDEAYSIRAALRIYSNTFSQGEALDEQDIHALYWLNCRAKDALSELDAGVQRASAIASKQLRKSEEQLERVQEQMNQMEPEVADGLTAMLEAVVSHGLPIKEAMAVFNEVVKEHRGKEAA